MGAILLGSAGQSPVVVEETQSIPIPSQLPTDPVVLVDPSYPTEKVDAEHELPSGGLTGQILAKNSISDYNDSIIELVSGHEVPDQGNLDAIVLPSTLPSPELVGQEIIAPVGEVIELPDVLPQDEIILTEDDDAIVIPDSIPAGQEVLTEGTILSSPTITPTVTTGDKYYLHTQSIASDVWSIYHNLQKRPAIHIEDGTGQEIFTQIIHVTNNLARAYFGKPYIGTAHCN